MDGTPFDCHSNHDFVTWVRNLWPTTQPLNLRNFDWLAKIQCLEQSRRLQLIAIIVCHFVSTREWFKRRLVKRIYLLISASIHTSISDFTNYSHFSDDSNWKQWKCCALIGSRIESIDISRSDSADKIK